MVTKRIAIIPARGGSKRISRKNVVPFLGRPMISWTIQAAVESNCFDEVLVSTDSAEIAEVSARFGAAVPFLREGNADDVTPVSEATISALKQAEAHWQTRFHEVVQLMPNCPLRNAEHVRSGVGYFTQGSHDYQISCFRYGWMNPWWASRLDEHNVPTAIFPEAMKQRSQDLPPLYCPTGALWIASRDKLLEARSFYGPGYRFCPLEWDAAVDIDDIDDLRFAFAVAGMRSPEVV